MTRARTRTLLLDIALLLVLLAAAGAAWFLVSAFVWVVLTLVGVPPTPTDLAANLAGLLAAGTVLVAALTRRAGR